MKSFKHSGRLTMKNEVYLVKINFELPALDLSIHIKNKEKPQNYNQP